MAEPKPKERATVATELLRMMKEILARVARIEKRLDSIEAEVSTDPSLAEPVEKEEEDEGEEEV